MKKFNFQFLLFSLLVFPSFSQKTNAILRLEADLKKAKIEHKRCEIYSKLSFEYDELDKNLANKYLLACFEISNRLQIDSLSIKYLNAKSHQLFIAANYDSSRITYLKMANLAEKSKRWYDFGNASIGVASCYQSENKLIMAIKHYDIAIESFEKISSQDMIIRATKRKASLLIQSKSYESGLKLLKECAKGFIKLNNQTETAYTFGSIGWAYRNQNQNDSAIHYLKKAGFLFGKLKEYSMIPVVTIEIGKAYAEKEIYQEALNYYKKAENEISSFKLEDFRHADALNNFISQTYIALKKYSEALPYTQKALKLAIESNDDEEMMDANYNMAIVNKNLGKFEQSVSQFEIYDSLRFKIEDAKERQNVANVIEKYQSEKKEQQLKVQDSELKRKSEQIIWLGVLTTLLILFALLFYNRYKLKQKNILQTAIYNQQTLATQAVLDGEERERKRIAADLHDGVGQTIMALKMNLLGINEHIDFKSEKAKEIFEKAVDLASESAKEVRAISHQMMPNALIKSGLASAIREFLGNLETQNLKINLEVNNLNEALEPTVEKVLYRVIQELVNNVIKHSKANILNITIDKTNLAVLAKIEDNGQGFNTQKSDFEGIGIKNIQDRIAFLKGNITISSEIGMGTKTMISIPLV